MKAFTILCQVNVWVLFRCVTYRVGAPSNSDGEIHTKLCSFGWLPPSSSGLVTSTVSFPFPCDLFFKHSGQAFGFSHIFLQICGYAEAFSVALNTV